MSDGDMKDFFEAQAKMFAAQGPAFAKFHAAMNDPAVKEAVEASNAAWAQMGKDLFDWSKGMAGAKVWRDMMDPKRFSAQAFLDAPNLADIGVMERLWADAAAAAAVLQQKQAAYQMVMAQAWGRAFQKFTKDVSADPAGQGPDARAALDRWLKMANDELIATQRTDAYLKAQADVLEADLEARKRFHAITEAWNDISGAPTRTEVDDLHQMVDALRREVRALKKAKP